MWKLASRKTRQQKDCGNTMELYTGTFCGDENQCISKSKLVSKPLKCHCKDNARSYAYEKEKADRWNAKYKTSVHVAEKLHHCVCAIISC